MDLVALDAMTTKILDGLDSISLVLDRDLVRLHRLLNGFANLAQSRVDTGHFNACVGRVFAGLKKVLVDWVERNRESTVSHETLDVAAVVDLHHIIVAKHCFVPNIRRPVGRAMVNTGAGREGDAGIETTRFDQATVCGLNLIADIHDLHARLNKLLCPLPGLAMDLRALPQIVIVRLKNLLLRSQLSAGYPVPIMVEWMLLDLAYREFTLFKLL